MSEIRETADKQRDAATIAKSLTRWFKTEQFRLRRERELFGEHLAGDELSRALRENAAEQRKLDAGWANSSLRRHIETRATQTTGGIEQRAASSVTSSAAPVLSRASTASSTRTTATSISGYAATFDALSQDLGGFRERLLPGCFAEAIKNSDTRCLLNHDHAFLLGRSTANTLELKEDHHGLYFLCHLLPFDALSYSVARRIDRLDLTGCSFCFAGVTDKWRLAQKPGELDIRTITRIDRLYDVGPVVYPAYPQTSVSATFETVERSAPAADEEAAFEAWEYQEWEREHAERNAPLTPQQEWHIERRLRLAQRIINRCTH